MNKFVHDDDYVVTEYPDGSVEYDDKISHSAVVGRAKTAARQATGHNWWNIYSVDYTHHTFEDSTGKERPVARTVLVRTTKQEANRNVAT